MRRFLSPKQLAQAIGVSESSIKRWCDNGLIQTIRTAGGHRRLRISCVFQFLRETEHEILDPTAIGLHRSIGSGQLTLIEARRRCRDALVSGDEREVGDLLLELYLLRHKVSLIADEVIAEAFHEIGDLWDCGDLAIYEERRACETCLNGLHQLRVCLPLPGASARTALGATLEGDPYTVAVTLGELVLRDVGWNAAILGNSLSLGAITAAMLEHQPRMVWVSVSSFLDEQRLIDGIDRLFDVASQQRTALAIGGRAIDESLRKRLRYSTFCDTLQHLEQFAATI